MMNLTEQISTTIERHHLLARGDRVVVGVSGGPDSLCLLHVLWSLRQAWDLHLYVAHLNHCLRGAEADADAAFVSRTAEHWGLPCYVEEHDVAALARERRLAVEEAARQARYAFLARIARQVGATRIVVGHNADDQAETVCMHWLRGSGLAGLRGMQPLSRLAELRLVDGPAPLVEDARALLLIRPLLAIPRSEIEAYCATHNLRPRFDQSNLDKTYFRNRIRHELLPFLETFNPRIRDVLRRSAMILSADHDFLKRATAEAWNQVVREQDAQVIQFDLVRWRSLPLSLQRSTLRQAIHQLRRSLRNINWIHVESALAILQAGHTGARATLPARLEAQIDYDAITIAERGYVARPPDQPWLNELIVLTVPNLVALTGSDWRLSASLVERNGLGEEVLLHAGPWEAYLDARVAAEPLYLRPRRAGDEFWPQGLGDKPTTVNHFMTNAKIPRAWRDHIPLLASQRHVLWVSGWRIDERVRVTSSTTHVLALAFEKQGEAQADAPTMGHATSGGAETHNRGERPPGGPRWVQ